MTTRQERFSGTREMSDWLRIDAERLFSYLAERVPGLEAPLGVRQFKGGQSNPTYLLEDQGGRKLVLRRKPPGQLLPSAHAVDREYRVITALHPTDVPVPRTLALCTDDAVIGTWFYVMEMVEGRVFWEPTLPDQTPAERAAVYDAMGWVLTRLHRVDPAAVGLADFGKPGNYFARQIHRWAKQYQLSATEEVPEMNALIEWLPRNIPQDDTTSLVHGDYRLDNMIFHPTEPRVVAVLDWELSTIGHPLGDFSYHSMPWHTDASRGGLAGLDLERLGIPTFDQYRRKYCERTGRAEIEHWHFYLAYNYFRSAAIAQGIAGRVRDGTAASEHAREIAASVPATARIAWEFAQRA